MDVRQIECFITVARMKSFSRASGVLYMTVPGVTRRINSLEEYLQFQLFERNNQGVELTPAGKAFYDDAVQILQMMRTAVENGRRLSGKAEPRLYIGTALPSKYLRSICQAYGRKSLYKLPLSYKQLTSNQGIDALLSRQIDMHLVVGSAPPRAGIRYDLISREKPQCLMSAEHPLSQKRQISLSDLEGETLLLPPVGNLAYFDRLREYLGEKYPGIHIETLEDAVSTYMHIETHKAFCITASLGGLDVPAICYKDVDYEQWPHLVDVYLARRDEPDKYIEDFILTTKSAMEENRTE